MYKLKKNIENFILKKYKDDDFIKDPTGYFYDLSAIGDNLKKLNNNCPKQLRLYYAMKANNNLRIMKFVTDSHFISGIEIASYGELCQALKHRKSNDIIFTGPGKTEYELEESIKNNIRLINVESIVEAIRINKIANELGVSNVDILIRINLNYSIDEASEHMGGCSTKMGIDEDVSFDAFRLISKLDRITIKGIHVFASSGVLDYRSLIKSNEYIFNLVLRLENEFGNISIIDFGGGLGIDYTDCNRIFDIDKYYLELNNLINKYGFLDKEIIMELGTYIVGNSGYYTSKIIDIKKIKGKKHIIIAGGVNHMGLPLEMRRKHPVCIINLHSDALYDNQPNVLNEISDISGPLCMVTDKLCWDEYIENAEIGDIVVFSQAGAYCYGEGMHDFLSHFYPKEIIIEVDNEK